MTKKPISEGMKKLIEESYCAFCHKKGCNNECQTYWDKTMLHLQVEGYTLEDLQYTARKAMDAMYEVQKEIDKKIEENLNCQQGWKKQKPRPVKKTG